MKTTKGNILTEDKVSDIEKQINADREQLEKQKSLEIEKGDEIKVTNFFETRS